ncbi:MAG: energy transducer TonB [Bacteroidetes bacterium]|nr:energy transducer TonB [Bacteroidota bacterium]
MNLNSTAIKLFIGFFLLPLVSLAQINERYLAGLWVKCKAEMLDGSRILDHTGCGMHFLKYKFTKKNIVESSTSVLFNEAKLPYKVIDSTLTIGATERYNIVRLTADSLELSEAITGVDSSKIRVYTFVKTQNIAISTESIYDPSLQDSVYVANNFLFPEFDGRSSEVNNFVTGVQGKYRLRMTFVINKTGNVKEITILNKDSIPDNLAKSVIYVFQELDSRWRPAYRNNAAVNTRVEVALTYTSIPGRVNAISIAYPFVQQVEDFQPLSFADIRAVNANYHEAIEQFREGDYQNAIDLLDRCIAMDSIDIDSYYLRAICNLKLGHKDKACSDLSYLAKLGQVGAAKSMKKLCPN